MFLLILESIGMQELILVGVVALIIFGPRKLPEMAKMIGKTMAEFRRVTGEFKETWEKEAKFDLEDIQDNELKTIENTKKLNGTKEVISDNDNEIHLPEIKEINAEDFNKQISVDRVPVSQIKTESEKRNWL